MRFYLDSARIEEARVAGEQGWVSGVTTNPALLAQSPFPPAEALKQLAALIPGEVCYQLLASELDQMLEEAEAVHKVLGAQTVLKIPGTATGMQAIAQLSAHLPCAVTAIYSHAQAAVAIAAGARYVIPYVNRTTRLLGDGLGFVRDLAQLTASTTTQILAASLKSPQEAVQTIKAGAHIVTLPLSVLLAMVENEHTRQTVDDFTRTGRGILSVI